MLCTVLLLAAGCCCAGPPVVSNVRVLSDHEYHLSSDGAALALVAKSGDSEHSRPVKLDGYQVGQITEMRLSPWVGSQLCAVLEIKLKRRFKYLCLTFPARDAQGVNPATVYVGEVVTLDDDHEIYALDTEAHGDGVRCLLVNATIPNGRVVMKSGVLFVHECPQPPVDGTLIYLAPIKHEIAVH